jgi:hypothetical protein
MSTFLIAVQPICLDVAKGKIDAETGKFLLNCVRLQCIAAGVEEQKYKLDMLKRIPVSAYDPYDTCIGDISTHTTNEDYD